MMKKGKNKNHGLLPNSMRIISSRLKTVSTNASPVAYTVRSAGASIGAAVSAASSEDQKDQASFFVFLVTWAGFGRLELGPSIFRIFSCSVTQMDFKFLMWKMLLTSVSWYQSVMVQFHSCRCSLFLQLPMNVMDAENAILCC